MRFWCESNLKHFLHGWFRIDADCALAALENRVDWLIIKILYFESTWFAIKKSCRDQFYLTNFQIK